MPPIRTMPPAKVLKTERTHEENQERAYIAASRRSDRSLEARVESARRASEIHKRRTGRSLRVTEQDVVNEEMYEEEDDDLPMQYRRLTAHLQTGSADFNRRLSAYLTNHVAMRSAFDQAISHSYAQQYPNVPQYAHNQRSFPSPFAPGSFPAAAAPAPHTAYGQPYPTPGTPGYRPNHPNRRTSHTASHASHEHTSYPQNIPTPSSAPSSIGVKTEPEQRKTSLSSHSASQSPAEQRTSIPPTPHSYHGPQPQLATTANAGARQSPSVQHQSPPAYSPYQNISPFSMSLPMESQMFLNGALDPNDPMTHALMAGSNNGPQGYGYADFSKQPNVGQPFGGMSATLAPSALDMQPRRHTYDHQASMTSATASSVPPSAISLDGADFTKGTMFPSSQGSQGSGTVTPGLDSSWDAFINDTGWTENAT